MLREERGQHTKSRDGRRQHGSMCTHRMMRTDRLSAFPVPHADDSLYRFESRSFSSSRCVFSRNLRRASFWDSRDSSARGRCVSLAASCFKCGGGFLRSHSSANAVRASSGTGRSARIGGTNGTWTHLWPVAACRTLPAVSVSPSHATNGPPRQTFATRAAVATRRTDEASLARARRERRAHLLGEECSYLCFDERTQHASSEVASEVESAEKRRPLSCPRPSLGHGATARAGSAALQDSSMRLLARGRTAARLLDELPPRSLASPFRSGASGDGPVLGPRSRDEMRQVI